MTQSRKNLYLVLLALALFGGLVIAQQASNPSDAGGPATEVAAPDDGSADSPQAPLADSDAAEQPEQAEPPAQTAAEPTPAADQTEEADVPEPTPTEGLISNATMEVFVPTEEISEDRSVSYPNDI